MLGKYYQTILILVNLWPAAAAHAAEGAQGPAPLALAPSRVVIAVMENRPYSRIIGNPAAPYINSLARRGALFSQSYAVAHPSQPNYLALFSGSTQGVRGNECPQRLSGDNLAAALMRAGRSFAIYSESMPSAGYTGCAAGDYVRKHNPAVNWQTSAHNGVPNGGQNSVQNGGLPASVNLPFTEFPSDLSRLPVVSMVVPNQANDMHDGNEPETIRRGDAWLRTHLDGYVQWADANNGLFILTWDEDDGSEGNRVATIFTGAMVRPGTYGQRIDHYSVLRTVLELFGLPSMGRAVDAAPIRGIWASPPRPGRR